MEFFSPESRSWKDYAWAITLGCVLSALSWWWGCAEIPPDLWEDVAVAAGVRPPVAPFPGLWHGLSCLLFRSVGLAKGVSILALAGPVSLGLLTAIFFLVFNELLPRTLRLRMKRARWSRLIVRHALGNALIPVLTVIGLGLGNLLGGMVLVETIFNWPGVGQFAYQSVMSADFPAIIGVALLIALNYMVINTVVDILYGVIDPRVRYG